MISCWREDLDSVIPQFPWSLALYITRCSLSVGVLSRRSKFIWSVQELMGIHPLLPEHVACCGGCFNTFQAELLWSIAKLSSHFLLFSMCLKVDSNNNCCCYNDFDVIMTDLSINVYWVVGQWRFSGKTRWITWFILFKSEKTQVAGPGPLPNRSLAALPAPPLFRYQLKYHFPGEEFPQQSRLLSDFCRSGCRDKASVTL